MNTYQITAVYCRDGHDVREEVELIDAPSLERARMRFLSAHPSSHWFITGEELIHTDISEDEAAKHKAVDYDRQAEAMRQAVAVTFERLLKNDLYLQAAQRGKEDFFRLLDTNSNTIADSVLGMYQRILNENE